MEQPSGGKMTVKVGEATSNSGGTQTSPLGRLTHTTGMCWAAAEGNVEMMKRLLDHGADVNAADYDKRTPLHIAVSENAERAVEFLMKCGAKIDTIDRWGRTPIDCAMEIQNARIIRLLEGLQFMPSMHKMLRFEGTPRGQKDRLRRSQSSTDISAFFRAVEAGNTEKVKRAWLDGLELNITDISGRTSLHAAVENAQVGVVELLLSADVNINVLDSWGRSPMSIAIEKQHFVIAEMLRNHQKQKLAIQAQNNEDQQYIARAFSATKAGDLEKVQRLVPKYVHPDVQDYDLRTLLHIASAEGHLHIAKHLVDCGANVNLLDRWGTSALAEAVGFAHNDLARFLIANHASESGHRATITIDHIDHGTLNDALEYILRLATRKRWLMAQVYCPTKDENDNCVLVVHSVWHKNDAMQRNDTSASPLLSPNASVGRTSFSTVSSNPGTLSTDSIQAFRKVGSLLMIDPGQGHTGSVFSGHHPEWLNLTNVQQSHFFLLPHARRAGIQTMVSVPMIYKMSTIAVLSWYSKDVISEDQQELQRIQRLIRSVTILCALRQELHTAASSLNGIRHVPHFQYCQLLDNAITANGELLDAKMTREDVEVGDTLPLAFEWGLFDMMHVLATSMSSEDHSAVFSLLRSIVGLLRNRLFDDVILSDSDKPGPNQSEITLREIIESSNGTIRGKGVLLAHLKYYLQYLHAVSPTEGTIFMDVNELLPVINKHFEGHHDESDGENQIDGADEETVDGSTMIDQPPVPTPAQPPATKCVLCQYNVPGHIHPGSDGVAPKVIPARKSPMFTSTSKTSSGSGFFGIPGNPKSPVLSEIELLLNRLVEEYDNFERKGALVGRFENVPSTSFTSSDLYDAIGAAHDVGVKKTYIGHSNDHPRKRLLVVINEIMHDSSCMITYKQLLSIHRCLIPESSGQSGVIRTSAAVGYASPRIYRVFLPVGEIAVAMQNLIRTVNDSSLWQQRPLLCAYYAFAVLVFYIHPFHDGNGRCARLLGNLIAKKLGYPSLFKAADKTIQVAEFLQKAIVTMDMLQNSRRQTRQSRGITTRKENTSMWF